MTTYTITEKDFNYGLGVANGLQHFENLTVENLLEVLQDTADMNPDILFLALVDTYFSDTKFKLNIEGKIVEIEDDEDDSIAIEIVELNGGLLNNDMIFKIYNYI